MPAIIHKSNSRGYANYGWLETYYSFSFADYYNPERMRFGTLRVLNDDTIKGGMGFGLHPHDNMEIITIPLEGRLRHADNLGNTTIISAGEIQVMSAGSGIMHSEFNDMPDTLLRILQIWIFPHSRNLPPRYEKKSFFSENISNTLQLIVSPIGQENSLTINQDSWLFIGYLNQNKIIDYSLKVQNHGIYLFVLNGTVQIENAILNTRDAIGITDIEHITIQSISNTKFLLIETPMN